MTKSIDIGCGINASEIVGDVWTNIPQPQTAAHKTVPNVNDLKSTFLNLKKAIIDKDFALFKKDLKNVEDLLSQKQTNSLGREILRNFDPRFAQELKKCQWYELVTTDTTIHCANTSADGFHFCLKILTAPNRHDDVMEKYFCSNALRDIFGRMSHMNEKNYENFNALRPLIVPHLKSDYKIDYKMYAVLDVIPVVYGTTPKTLLWNQGLMDDLANMDVDWEAVFGYHHPFEVSKEESLFGAVAFFQRHPKIFEAFTKWNTTQQEQYQKFAEFCLKEVFAVDASISADRVDLFTQEFFERYRPEIDSYLGNGTATPNSILYDFKNGNSSVTGRLKDAIKSVAKEHNVETNFQYVSASECLFEHDPTFLNTVLKSSNGLRNVQEYAQNSHHLEILTRTVHNSPISQQKQLLQELAPITDNDGNTISHILAQKLCKEDLRKPQVQKLVLLCMKTNWSTKNKAGATPQTLFAPNSEDMHEVAQGIFKTHLSTHLKNHLKHEKIKPAKTSLRKM